MFISLLLKSFKNDDIRTILKLSRSLKRKDLKKLRISDIRSAKIVCRFKGVQDFYESMRTSKCAIRRDELLDRENLANLDNKNLHMEEYLYNYLNINNSIDKANMALKNSILRLVQEIISHERTYGSERTSYYWRICRIYFQEYQNWIEAIQIMETKR